MNHGVRAHICGSIDVGTLVNTGGEAARAFHKVADHRGEGEGRVIDRNQSRGLRTIGHTPSDDDRTRFGLEELGVVFFVEEIYFFRIILASFPIGSDIY